MGLLDVQSVLTRLYTDSAYRARFFTDPTKALGGTALTDAEQRQLAALDPQQVERFARSLKQKRLGLVRELLPGTARVMGDRLAETFFLYCDRQPSALERVDEAMAFTDCLFSEVPAQGQKALLPAYWGDLITCERLRLAVLRASPDPPSPGAWGSPASAPSTDDLLDSYPQLTAHARVAAFEYDMEILYPKLLRGEVIEAPRAPCFILIARVRGASGVRLKRLTAASARLLTLCNGTRKLREILDEAAAGLRLSSAERPEFVEECIRFLTPFIEHELVRLLTGVQKPKRSAAWTPRFVKEKPGRQP